MLLTPSVNVYFIVVIVVFLRLLLGNLFPSIFYAYKPHRYIEWVYFDLKSYHYFIEVSQDTYWAKQIFGAKQLQISHADIWS